MERKEMLMDDVCTIARIFMVLGQQVVQEHTSDLIIDLPQAVKKRNDGEVVKILVRGNGADLIDRYRKCLQGSGRPYNDEACIEYATRSLGWWLCVTIHLNNTIEIQVNNSSVDERGNIIDDVHKNVLFYRHHLSSVMSYLEDLGYEVFETKA